MTRRRSSLDDFVDLLMLLPWWASAVLAPISYWWLTQYAPQIEFKSPFFKAIPQVFPLFAPYVAIGFGGIAIAILFKQWHRRRLLDRQQGIESIRGLSWREFEWLIGEAFRRQGCQVVESDRGPDDGIDLVLMKDGRKTLVQCKHWKKSKVSVAPVRELLGTVHAKGADAGVFVCSGEYTKPAVEFAWETGIRLIDGTMLEAMIREVQKAAPVQPEFTVPVASVVQPVGENAVDVLQVLACPRCGSGMVKRVAKRGENQGRVFWGCGAFPQCRGVLSVVEEW